MKKSWWEVAETIFFGILTPLILGAIIIGFVASMLWIAEQFMEALAIGGL